MRTTLNRTIPWRIPLVCRHCGIRWSPPTPLEEEIVLPEEYRTCPACREAERVTR